MAKTYYQGILDMWGSSSSNTTSASTAETVTIKIKHENDYVYIIEEQRKEIERLQNELHIANNYIQELEDRGLIHPTVDLFKLNE